MDIFGKASSKGMDIFGNKQSSGNINIYGKVSSKKMNRLGDGKDDSSSHQKLRGANLLGPTTKSTPSKKSSSTRDRTASSPTEPPRVVTPTHPVTQRQAQTVGPMVKRKMPAVGRSPKQAGSSSPRWQVSQNSISRKGSSRNLFKASRLTKSRPSTPRSAEKGVSIKSRTEATKKKKSRFTFEATTTNNKAGYSTLRSTGNSRRKAKDSDRTEVQATKATSSSRRGSLSRISNSGRNSKQKVQGHNKSASKMKGDSSNSISLQTNQVGNGHSEALIAAQEATSAAKERVAALEAEVRSFTEERKQQQQDSAEKKKREEKEEEVRNTLMLEKERTICALQRRCDELAVEVQAHKSNQDAIDLKVRQLEGERKQLLETCAVERRKSAKLINQVATMQEERAKSSSDYDHRIEELGKQLDHVKAQAEKAQKAAMEAESELTQAQKTIDMWKSKALTAVENSMEVEKGLRTKTKMLEKDLEQSRKACETLGSTVQQYKEELWHYQEHVAKCEARINTLSHAAENEDLGSQTLREGSSFLASSQSPTIDGDENAGGGEANEAGSIGVLPDISSTMISSARTIDSSTGDEIAHTRAEMFKRANSDTDNKNGLLARAAKSILGKLESCQESDIENGDDGGDANEEGGDVKWDFPAALKSQITRARRQSTYLPSRQNTYDNFLPSRQNTAESDVRGEDWNIVDDFAKSRFHATTAEQLRESPLHFAEMPEQNLPTVIGHKSVDSLSGPSVTSYGYLRMLARIVLAAPHVSLGILLAISATMIRKLSDEYPSTTPSTSWLLISPLMLGLAVGAFISLKLADTSDCCGYSLLIRSPSTSFVAFVCFRSLSAVGIGISVGIGPIYYYEYLARRTPSCRPIRYLSTWTSTGMCLGCCAAYFLGNGPHHLLFVSIAPAVVQFLGAIGTVKESPYWVLRKRGDARAALLALRETILPSENSHVDYEVLQQLLQEVRTQIKTDDQETTILTSGTSVPDLSWMLLHSFGWQFIGFEAMILYLLLDLRMLNITLETGLLLLVGVSCCSMFFALFSARVRDHREGQSETGSSSSSGSHLLLLDGGMLDIASAGGLIVALLGVAAAKILLVDQELGEQLRLAAKVLLMGGFFLFYSFFGLDSVGWSIPVSLMDGNRARLFHIHTSFSRIGSAIVCLAYGCAQGLRSTLSFAIIYSLLIATMLVILMARLYTFLRTPDSVEPFGIDKNPGQKTVLIQEGEGKKEDENNEIKARKYGSMDDVVAPS